MITFTREGEKVRIRMEYKSGQLDKIMFFDWNTGGEILAEALVKQLNEHYEKTIEREIETAYEAGYKAGRQRKKKRTWFHSFLTHINKEIQDWKKE